MRKLWDKFVALLYKVGEDKWFHFMAGLIVAAALVIWTGWCWSALIAAAAIGIAKEVFDIITTKVFDWNDFVAAFAGGVLIWLIALI